MAPWIPARHRRQSKLASAASAGPAPLKRSAINCALLSQCAAIPAPTTSKRTLMPRCELVRAASRRVGGCFGCRGVSTVTARCSTGWRSGHSRATGDHLLVPPRDESSRRRTSAGSGAANGRAGLPARPSWGQKVGRAGWQDRDRDPDEHRGVWLVVDRGQPTSTCKPGRGRLPMRVLSGSVQRCDLRFDAVQCG